MAVQSRINGELGRRLDDGVLAALLSFGSGLLLLAVVVLLAPPVRRGLLRVGRDLRRGALRPWQLLGGLGGATLVASQGLTVATLGVAVFSVAVVAGQLGAALVVDRVGLGPAGASPLTARRLLGAGLALIAVVVAVSDAFGAPAVLALAVLPLLAGAAISWQQAVNGRVAVAGGPLPAAFVNFVVGTTALAVAAGAVRLLRGPALALPSEPWLYVGGAVGVAFIATAAVVVRVIGVLLLSLGIVAGQVLGALAVDIVAPAGRSVTPVTVVGAVLALLAVAVAVSRDRGGARGQAASD